MKSLVPLSLVLFSPFVNAQPGAELGPRKLELRPIPKFLAFTAPVREAPEPGRKLGRVHVGKTIESLKIAKVQAYAFLIHQGPNDFEDLKRLLPVARQAGVQIWAGVVPPSLGGNSLPYKGDWKQWAREFCKLAGTYRNLTAMFIPDIQQANNTTYLHAVALRDIRKMLNDAGLRFFGTIYDVAPEHTERFAKSLDGLVVIYTNYRKILNLDGFLLGARANAAPGWTLLAGYYAAPQWWDPHMPEPVYLYYAMRRAFARTDGVCLIDLDLSAPSKIRPGRAGFSNLLYTVRDFAAATYAGELPQRPVYR